MVFKSILNDYYDIPLNQFGFFTYKGMNYYLTKNNDLNLYQQYIDRSQFSAFIPVKNIFNQYISQDYILYSYTNNNIDIHTLIKHSLNIVGKTSVMSFKKNWIKNMNDVYRCMQNKMIFHYNFALGQLAIELMNFLAEKDSDIYLGIEHVYTFPDVKNICNPDNLVIAPRIQDLSYLFMFDFITEDQFTEIVVRYNLSRIDLVILLCQSIFPYFFYMNIKQKCFNENEEIKRLNYHIGRIKAITRILNNFIEIPEIFWIK